MSGICGWFKITPQAHYQMKRRQEKQQAVDKEIVSMVQTIRSKHNRIGTRKLLHLLQEQLAAAGICIGRDRFFDLMRREGLLVRPKRNRARTTWAGNWRCENLLQDRKVTRPNEAWVTDITYIETEKGFNYLALVTDLYSRRIVGFDLSDTLAHEGAKRAFDMAVRYAGKQAVKGLIHHSDRGSQYTSGPYRRHLRKHGVRSSMGASGNCYDNAVAERVNGIVKLEYGFDACFPTTQIARRAIAEGISLYNHERPHLSLQMHKPDDVYHGRSQLRFH